MPLRLDEQMLAEGDPCECGVGAKESLLIWMVSMIANIPLAKNGRNIRVLLLKIKISLEFILIILIINNMENILIK